MHRIRLDNLVKENAMAENNGSNVVGHHDNEINQDNKTVNNTGNTLNADRMDGFVFHNPQNIELSPAEGSKVDFSGEITGNVTQNQNFSIRFDSAEEGLKFVDGLIDRGLIGSDSIINLDAENPNLIESRHD